MSSCYVTLVSPSEAKQLQQKLLESDFAMDHPPFTRFRARKEGVSCMVYLSGKVLVQGSETSRFVAHFFPNAAKPAEPTHSTQNDQQHSLQQHTPCMGFDESGKGDVFGPLCLSGVYVGDDAAQLIEWGVCDSKQLTPKQILLLAPKIRLHYPHADLVLMPEQYNALYATKFHNLNRLLAWGHVQVMSELYQKTKCTRAVLDQFATSNEVETLLKRKHKEIQFTQRIRAESSEIAVAAASILARSSFVEGMEALSQEFGITLPKGATHGMVQAGKRILGTFGEEGLAKTMKLHFKTLTAIRG